MRKIHDKRFITIMTMFVLLQGILFPAFFVEAKNNAAKNQDDFKVKMECGIDGYAVYDNPAVVKVTIESRNNFTGILRIIPAVDNGQKIAAYGEEISLAAGEAKTFTFVPSSLGNSGKIRMELLDEAEKVLYSESKQLTLFSAGNNVTVGILSDDYSALNYFDGIAVDIDGYQGVLGARTLELTEDSMPADSSALSVLNYIILDNFDTAGLSDKQYAALKNWVNDGGVLILALGSNYQNVLNRFSDDFIAGTIGKLEKRNIEWLLPQSAALLGTAENDNMVEGEKSQSEDDITDEEEKQSEDETAKQQENWLGDESIEENQPEGGNTDSDLSDSRMSVSNVDSVDFVFTDAAMLSDFSDDGTAYQKCIGAGRVVVLSYALGMEPMTSSSFRAWIAGLLLRTSAVNATLEHLDGVGYASGNWYNGMSLANLADDSKKPSALLYGSILILYVILVGPVLYLILKAVKKREKIWIAVPIVALVFTGIIYLTGFIYRISKPLVNTFSLVSLEKEFKKEDVYTDITCPKARKYKIKLKEGYTDFKYYSDYYSYNFFTAENSDREYDYMICKADHGTELTLNNTETFENTSFVVEQTSENDIGTIDCDLKCYTTGFEGTITNNTKYDLTGVVVTFEKYLYQAGDMKKGEQVTIDSSKLIESMGYGSFEQIYRNMDDFSSANRKLYTQYQIDTNMEDGFIDVNEYNKGYIWAGVEDYKPEIAENTGVKQSGIGVLFETYEAAYEDVEGVYYSSLEPMAVSSQGEYDTTSGMIYNDAVTITYSFENSPGITTLENLSYGGGQSALQSVNNGSYAKVSAYNPETGIYDVIFENSGILSGDDLKKYISGNIIILRYEMDETGYSTYMPRIIARGDE